MKPRALTLILSLTCGLLAHQGFQDLEGDSFDERASVLYDMAGAEHGDAEK
jgi:hypothetical protein